ncbi:3-hydroxyacyl-CoA dehydrogenase [Corticibacter populi]|uniref:L-gulonate 3-dehydrogenase n=2 Tax=Corticibacter populi TaxID=1550736 RepID=A0A3M6QU05_9BURK|nr:3-hydroxyacyl-CoA dehydrogenase [Corticibacter populi]
MRQPPVAGPSGAGGLVGVIGAGRMGRSIGVAFALAGTDFLLMDLRQRTDEAWRKLEAEVASDLQAMLARLCRLGRLDAVGAAEALRRIRLLRATEVAAALPAVDVLFEAVPETMEAKREALGFAGAHLPEQALVASTSSTMLAGELATLVPHPERFLNAHWLNPAYLIPLVEVSPHAATAGAVLERLLAVLRQAGKQPVVCHDRPGYIVPRLQVLIMNEAARMIEDGTASAADIDVAIRYGFGIRYASMGVAEFVDFGGLDILYHASAYLADRLADSRYASPPIVQAKMQRGELGIKTGQGLYAWNAEQAEQFQQEALERMVRLLDAQQVDTGTALPRPCG